MAITHLTLKDLRVFFKDRGALVYLFLLPLVFILLFTGLASRGQGASWISPSETDKRTPLVVVNLDPDGSLAGQFLAELDRSGGYRLQPAEASQALESMQRLKLGRYLIIPENFSADLAAGKPVSLELRTHPDSDAEQNLAALQVISGAARDLSLELQILDGLKQMGEMQMGFPGAALAFTPERLVAQARSQFERSRQEPLVAVVQSFPDIGEAEAAREPEFNFVTSIVPGFSVLFVFLAAQSVARGIFEERQSGSLRRLLAAPLPRWQLLLGKLLPVLLLTLVQVGFIFAAGALIMPLLGFGRLGIGKEPATWALASLLLALTATSLGLMIASLARTEAQISGISNGVLWIAGMLGGTLIPVFMFPTALQFLARLTPHYWATQAYNDLLARGLGFSDVLPELAALLGFSLVFFLVGLIRFRFE